MQSVVALTAADIPDCLALSTEAAWNQNEADWQRIIGSGEAYGLRDDGALIASSAILPYGASFGWICMILVTQRARRHGHAKNLMQYCIERLEQRGLVAGLDATPAGRTVYVQLGFEDIYELSRLYAAQVSLDDVSATGISVAPISAEDWPALLQHDRDAFGGDRASLLTALHRDRTDLCHVAKRDGVLVGYVFGRGGHNATQIGPLVADTPDVACTLADAALRAVRGPAVIDVPDHQPDFQAWLARSGFAKQRTFTRMLRKRSRPFERPHLTMAITGPEFG